MMMMVMVVTMNSLIESMTVTAVTPMSPMAEMVEMFGYHHQWTCYQLFHLVELVRSHVIIMMLLTTTMMRSMVWMQQRVETVAMFVVYIMIIVDRNPILVDEL